MADRRVKVIIEAEIAKFREAMRGAKKDTEDLGKSTEKLGRSTDSANKSADERAHKIKVVADADQRAAKAAGLLYNAQGQLADSNGKVLSSTQAAAHGVEAFSEAVYLAGYETEQLAEKEKRAAEESKAAADKRRQAWEDLAPALAGIGAIGVAGFAKAVTTAASFDKAMSGVQAATHASAADMEALSEAAITAGADTAYSAEEAAGAITELSKAGVSTADVLNGGLNGALSLAAAGELDVAKAAEIAASAMTQFKLNGDQIPHVADLLAAGAGKAQGSVEDLGNALNQAGLVANSTGLTIEETTGGLAAFASAGLTGSDAGTSFKSMLQRLTPQSKEAANLMEELGLSAYDSSGEFIGLSEYAGLLKEKLSGMSSEQRNATMATLFGSDAVRAANVLYEQGAEGIQGWEEAVSDAGYAAETAAIMQDNLAGDLEKLGGAFDTVFLQAGTGANEALRGVVQGVEGFVDTVGKLPTPVLQTAAAVSGIVGAVGLAGAGFITVLPKIKETKDALQVLAPVGTKAGDALRGLGKAAGYAGAVAAVGVALISVYNATREAGPGVEEVTQALIRLKETSDATDLDELFSFGTGDSGQNIVGFVETLNALDLSGPNDHLASFGDTVLGINNPLSQARDAVATLDESLSAMDAATAAEHMNRLRLEAEAAGNSDLSNWESLKEMFPEYTAAIEAAANATGQATTDADLFQAAMGNLPPHMRDVGDAGAEAAAGAEEAAEGIDDMSMSADEAADHLESMLDSLRQMGLVERDARAAAREYQAAIDDVAASLKENGATLDVNTEKGRANAGALDAIAAAGLESAAAMAENGAGHAALRDQLSGTYDQLVTSAQGFGLSEAKAEAYARSILGIPDNVSVETYMDERAKEVADATGVEVASIQESVNVITSMDGAAQAKAFETAAAVKAIPGFKKVDVAVSDQGTPGQIQSRINKITGKTEYVFVTEDGTTAQVQQQIVNIDGVDRTVYVDDDGTVYTTQGEINGIRGKDVTIRARAETGDANSRLAALARDRYTRIIANVVMGRNGAKATLGYRAGVATGGMVGRDNLVGYADGGRLPYTGLGTDRIMGVGSDGMPTALVDDGEWVVREASSRKYNRLLSLLNADHPSVRHLAGYASGGVVGREWSGGSMAPQVTVAGGSFAAPSAGEIAAALAPLIGPGDVYLDGRKVGNVLEKRRRS